jgi:hypothetical protein
MSDYDPKVTRTTEVHQAPSGETVAVRTETRTPSNGTGWWAAALVAIIAIVAVVWMLTANQNATTDQQVADAIDTARNQGIVDGAQTALSATQAAAQSASASMASDAARASDQARVAAENAADRASAAASASVPAAPSPEPVVSIPSQDAPPAQ